MKCTLVLRAMSVTSLWHDAQCKPFACCAYGIDWDQHEFNTFAWRAMSVKSPWQNAHCKLLDLIGSLENTLVGLWEKVRRG